MAGSTERDHSTAAYAILGLLSVHGPHTIYDLKGLIEGSIGYFWTFPHSQMYAETKRLETAGLIRADAEAGGRGRRVLHVTDDGRRALEAWWRREDGGETEIRDLGLLKLFLADPADGAGVAELAARQAAAHAERLALYTDLADDATRAEPSMRAAYRTVDLGLSYERAAVAFWRSVEADFG